MTKNNILNYINNSPLIYENPSVNFANMSEEQLLAFIDGIKDTRPYKGKHSYNTMLLLGASFSQRMFSMRKLTKEHVISFSASVMMQMNTDR